MHRANNDPGNFRRKSLYERELVTDLFQRQADDPKLGRSPAAGHDGH